MSANCATSDVEMVETFLNENYELRYNALSHKLEVRERCLEEQGQKEFRPFTQETKNSIVIAARKELGDPKGLKTLVGELIHSENTPRFDPIGHYLDTLPAWDGQDHVSALLRRLPGLDEQHESWLHSCCKTAKYSCRSTKVCCTTAKLSCRLHKGCCNTAKCFCRLKISRCSTAKRYPEMKKVTDVVPVTFSF